MNKEKFAFCMAAMFEAFGAELTDAALQGYWLGLDDMTIEQVTLGVANAIRSCRFLPKPIEIRELAGCWVDPDAAAQLAFTRALYAVSACGPYKTVDFEDRAINAVIRSMGGWPNFCTRFSDAESEMWTRKDFLRGYKNFAWRAVSEEASAPLVGMAEVSNNRPCRPARISCEWYGPERKAIRQNGTIRLVSQEVA